MYSDWRKGNCATVIPSHACTAHTFIHLALQDVAMSIEMSDKKHESDVLSTLEGGHKDTASDSPVGVRDAVGKTLL